ncbi:MAG: leucine-rich repeat domain-containing protein [Alistipes sp.]|nr:leucine-rich repeat domain-containing protein [Alistipes sp.]
MNRLFKYILLLIIAACGLACSEEVDLTTYKALEIEYVTSNRQAISNLRQWHGEDSYSIIADTYQENSNRGSLFVYPDVSIFGSWFQGCENLTEVYIPSGIKYISEDAFYLCHSLTSVTIPDSVTTIGNYAFKECECLESVTIPENVNYIGSNAFWGCLNLERVYCKATTPPVLESDEDTYQTFRHNAVGRKIYVPSKSIIAYRNAKGWSEYADAIVGYNFETGEVDNYDYKNNKIYYTNGSTTTPTQPNNTSVFDANIVSNMYDSLSKCWVITFDADITTIGYNAFLGCSSLTSVTIPESVTTIRNSAFRECKSLVSFDIPDSVTTIEDNAFLNCSSLTSVYCAATTPPSLGGDYVFGGNTSDRKIYVPAESVDAYKSAEYWSSYADAIKAYDFENGVVVEPEVSINNVIHYTATAKVEADSNYPWSFDTFGANILSHDFNEESGEGVITFDADVTTIGSYAFRNCDSLTSVTIPDSVTTIVSYAFYGCDSLISITIPDSVTTIGNYAYYNCSSLASVYCEATTPPSLGGSSVFKFNASGRLIYVPAASVEAYKTADYWSEYADAIIAYDFENGVVVEPEVSVNNEIRYTATAKVEANSDYPWSFDTFGANILSHDFNEESGEGVITFDAEVTTIGNYAFAYCSSLTSITIPDSVMTIGEYAFFNCDSLTSITIGDSVTTIGARAFRDCNSLTSVTIPDSVTTIGDFTFYNCSSLTSVTIGDSVTTIGDYAFEYCYSLTSVTIPDSVTTIGNGAFAYCSSLTSVYCEATTPPSLGGSVVFDDNVSGRTIYVPAESIETYKSAEGWSDYVDAIVGYNFETGEEVMPDEMQNRVIYYTATKQVEAHSAYPWTFDTFGANVVSHEWDSESGDGVITFEAEVTTIGDYAFNSCKSLTSVTIPDSVTTIGDSTFNDCSSLTSVTIPDSVTTIGEEAFRECTSLTSVTIGDGVITIGNSAFNDCSSLTSVTIPDSVTTIGDLAFSYCESLTSVTIGDSVTTIGDYVFMGCSKLEGITIPNSVNTIGESIFAYCPKLSNIEGKFASDDGRCLVVDGTLNSFAPSGLTSYVISDNVDIIGDFAFINCDNLTDITIPNSVTTIEYSAFAECYSLTNITWGNNVKIVSFGAFQECSSLTNITIPESVVQIEGNAFAYCDNLTNVYCKSNTPPTAVNEGSGYWYAFSNNAADRKIYVPYLSAETYKSAYGWSEYADAITGYDFETGSVIELETDPNKVIYYTAKAKIKASTEYYWSDETFGASIKYHLWNSETCEGAIAFNGDVTTIHSSAFRYCEGGLTSIIIPNSVKGIGSYAFIGCDDLVSIDFGEGVTGIGNAAFSGCESLASVVLPDSVETISELAFVNCPRITSVIIGKSVGAIGVMAFDGCESLVSVYCKPDTPPRALLGEHIKWYAFSDNASNRKIYVPTESADAYQSAKYWSDYADAIVGYDFNTTITPDGGIDDAEEDDEVIL